MRRSVFFLVIGCIVLFQVQCQKPGRIDIDHIILITLDTLRWDYIGAYSHEKKTAFLDRIAREGIVFEHAYTPLPLTLPAHISLFTGLYPWNHRIYANGMKFHPENRPYLPALLQKAGYRTYGAVATYILNRRFGIAYGFDEFSDLIPQSWTVPYMVGQISARTQNERVQRFLESINPGEKVFMWVHYYDPHAPYGPPEEPWKSRYNGDLRNRYEGDVQYLDAMLSELWTMMNEKGLLQRALVWFVSDHGEGLHDHDERTHGFFLYETTVRIPSLLWLSEDSGFPDSLRGRRVRTPHSLIDVMPTILELASVSLEDTIELDGISLKDALFGRPEPSQLSNRSLYSLTLEPAFMFLVAPLVAEIRRPYKFILSPDEELYDIGKDPYEKKNVFPLLEEENKRDIHTFRANTRHILNQVVHGFPGNSVNEEREQLLSLGYSGVTSTPAQWNMREDPKKYIQFYNRVLEAMDASNRGRLGEALLKIDQVLKELSGSSAKILEMKAGLLSRARRFTDAIQTISEAIRIAPSADLYMYRGRWYLAMGDLNRALQDFQQALRMEKYEFTYYWCIDVYMRLNRVQDARQLLEEALQVYPESPQLLTIGASVWIALRDLEKAENFVDRALALYPKNPAGLAYKAVVLLGKGEKKRALEVFEQAKSLSPGDFVVRSLSPYFLKLQLQLNKENQN